MAKFKARHLGLGYGEKFPGSMGMRDTEHGVAIDVVLAGDYPGDGRPKPVAFPDPARTAVRGERIALLPLPRLIELKLASGMTAPHRLKDLADVLELVRALHLPAEMAEDLDPYVREKYRELWPPRPGSRSEAIGAGRRCPATPRGCPSPTSFQNFTRILTPKPAGA